MRAACAILLALALAGARVSGAADAAAGEEAAPAAASWPIEHVVVLMEENRSFDHMLGFLKRLWPEIDGLTGTESQPRNTTDPSKGSVPVNDHAFNTGPDDPCHGHWCTDEGIFGIKGPDNMSGTPVMNGFVQNALRIGHTADNPVSMWAPENVPVITTLAQEFVLFDNFFCSHPGPTYPNRQFVVSGTAHGETDDEVPAGGFPQKTLFSKFADAGLSWKMHYEGHGGLNWALFLSELRLNSSKPHLQPMEQFYADAASGDLATFTFIEPRISLNASAKSEKSFGLPNHQHPDASVLEGERLMKNIYEALRKGPQWNKTLFVLTYDEHGGFYDHVPPPQTGVPNPDGINTKGGFTYDRLGVRVPFLLISPWVDKHVLVHEPPPQAKRVPSSQWELSSVVGTLIDAFKLPGGYLTKRDAWAASFQYLLEGRTEPRTDCPLTMPSIPPPTDAELEAEYTRQAALPIGDHHIGVIGMLCDMNGRADDPTCGAEVKTHGQFTPWQKAMWDQWMAA